MTCSSLEDTKKYRGNVLMNKVLKIIPTFLLGLSLGGVTSTTFISTTVNATALKTVHPDPNASEREWTYKDNVFDAGNETYRFTKHKVMKVEGKNYLILYVDVTNNSTKSLNPSLVTMVLRVTQDTPDQVKTLEDDTIATDANGLEPLEDNLYDKLKPGKAVHACIEYELADTKSPVTINFLDSTTANTIGQKTIQLKH